MQSLGGRARAAALSPEQRQEIARKGAQTRWAGHDKNAMKLTKPNIQKLWITRARLWANAYHDTLAGNNRGLLGLAPDQTADLAVAQFDQRFPANYSDLQKPAVTVACIERMVKEDREKEKQWHGTAAPPYTKEDMHKPGTPGVMP